MKYMTRACSVLLGLAISTSILAQSVPQNATSSTESSSTSASQISLTATDPFGGVSQEASGLSSCFDYYRFGSVPIVLSTKLAQTSQGAQITFTGVITNENSYPVTDATVYVKIFRVREAVRTDANGPDVVAFFPALEQINLAAKESRTVSFSWKVPAQAEPGDYRAATFVVTNDRFEMSGLVFTDDVVGSSVNFKVVGENLGSVRFVKEGAKINDVQYHYAAFPPRVAQSQSSVFSSEVINTSDIPFKGYVVWTLHYWDPIQKSHTIDTRREEVKMHPQSTATVTYTATDKNHSVYYLEGKLYAYDDSLLSIIGPRFVRSGVNEPRFNFVGIVDGTAVACIHSTGEGNAVEGRVELSVMRDTWYWRALSLVGVGELAKASYSGPVPGEIVALTKKLSATGSSYRITADLYWKGIQTDSVDIRYSCKDLGTSCTKETVISVSLVLLIMILVALVVFGIRRSMLKARKQAVYTPPIQ